MFKLIY